MMNKHFMNAMPQERKARRNGRVRVGVAAALALMAGTALLRPQTALTAPRAEVGQPPWIGSRVLLLLPVHLGPNWNADQATGQAILAPSEARLVQVLGATGKFQVIQPHRFSPILQRALSEKLISDDEFAAFRDKPSLETARPIVSKITFDQPAMIADFALDEVRGGGTAKAPSVQMQVTGQLYQGSDPLAFRFATVTSDPAQQGQNSFERALNAAQDSFTRVSAEFVKPLADITVPVITPLPTSTPDPKATPAPAKPGKPGKLGKPGKPVTSDKPASAAPVAGDAAGDNGATPAQAGAEAPEAVNPINLGQFPQSRRPLVPGSTDPNRFNVPINSPARSRDDG